MNLEICIDSPASARAAEAGGADGVVLGCLTPDGTVDRDACLRLLEAAGPLDVTFHRAFDLSRDLFESLEAIASLGIRRLLTSGGAPDALAGAATLSRLVDRAGSRLSIMPGGGITPRNLAEIVRTSGACEVHLSARSTRLSPMRFRHESCALSEATQGREYELRIADPLLVRAARTALDSVRA